MADLDRELSDRLSRLASAVPVSPGRVDKVHAEAVTARHAVRMAWVTPLVVLAVLIVGASLAGVHLGPGSTSQPTTGTTGGPTGSTPSEAPSAIDRDGPYALEIRAGKARYAPGEAIDVVASLLFSGPQGSIEFQHDSSGPIMFGIREKVFGELEVGGASDLMFDQTTLQRDVALVQQFRKGGGFSGEHPDAAMFRAWMQDPVLRLPEGTWHIYARATGSTAGGDSDRASFDVGAEIVILVAAEAAATPGLPAPTEWADQPVYGGDDIGSAALQLKSEHPRYEAGAPIELSAWYWFMQGQEVVASYFAPETALSIEQLDAKQPTARRTTFDSACVDLGHVEGVERHIAVGPSNIELVRGDALPSSDDQLFVDGSLRLPAGRWRISASVSGSFGPCSDPGEAYSMHAALEIDVAAPPAAPGLGPSAAPDASLARPWRSSVAEGDLELSIVAAKPTFSTDEALDVRAIVTYRGPEERVTAFSSWWGPITFSMDGAAGVTLLPHGANVCTEFELVRDVPFTARLANLNGEPRPFALPHGLYAIVASAAVKLGNCAAGSQMLQTSAVIAVSSGEDDIPIWTEHHGPSVCLLLHAGGRLEADAGSGLGIVDGNDRFHIVFWPPGFGARTDADGPVLLGPDAEVIARVGDQVAFDAFMRDDLPVRPCGPVTVEPT